MRGCKRINSERRVYGYGLGAVVRNLDKRLIIPHGPRQKTDQIERSINACAVRRTILHIDGFTGTHWSNKPYNIWKFQVFVVDTYIIRGYWFIDEIM